MVSRFILRNEGDTTNPLAARLYGLGLTQGRVVLYNSGTRTTLLAVLAQGSRFRDDLPCSRAVRVFYAGFDLPEFDSTSARNWLFHQGKVTKAPGYQPITSVDTTANSFRFDNHGYVSGDLIAFHARGRDVVLPAPSVGVFAVHTQYMVSVIDANNYQVLNQLSGAPDTANAFDWNTGGTNIDRLFSYKGNTFYFDPEQGKPQFFPAINFTFAGLTYIEMMLPTELSTGEDEPTNIKVVMAGKLVYDIDVDGRYIKMLPTFTEKPNNALVVVDALRFDQQLPITRLGNTFVDWKDRCEEKIPWIGGIDTPQVPAVFPTITAGTLTHNLSLNRLTKETGGDAFNASAYTGEMERDFSSFEFKYAGGEQLKVFYSDDTVGTNRHGIEIATDKLYYLYNGTSTEIIDVAPSDKIKIAFENDLLVIYKNSIPMPMVDTSYEKRWSTYHIGIEMFQLFTYIDEMLLAPSGTETRPLQVSRFDGGFVAPLPTPVSDLMEAEIHLSPGSSWADIDGLIQVAPTPERLPVFTFIFDKAASQGFNPPTGFDVTGITTTDATFIWQGATLPAAPCNISKVTVRRRRAENTPLPNFWRFIFRDSDDSILSKKFVTVNREALREANKGRLVDTGAQNYGVLNQSQMERIGETVARRTADLDVFFTVEAFLDSKEVCKGSYVYLVDPVPGSTIADPIKCEVIEERTSGKDVETRTFELQIITEDVYTDIVQGVATPPQNSTVLAPFIPPPPASALSLFATTEPMPDGSTAISVSGNVDFSPAISGDSGKTARGHVFKKILTSPPVAVTYDNGTNLFTGTSPAPDQPLQLVSTLGNLPGGSSVDREYYAVNIVGSTFKLSLEQGGTALSFTTNGAGLQLYNWRPWQDTNIDIKPGVNLDGDFELFPVPVGYVLVRVQTFSSADASMSFAAQITAGIAVA